MTPKKYRYTKHLIAKLNGLGYNVFIGAEWGDIILTMTTSQKFYTEIIKSDGKISIKTLGYGTLSIEDMDEASMRLAFAKGAARVLESVDTNMLLDVSHNEIRQTPRNTEKQNALIAIDKALAVANETGKAQSVINETENTFKIEEYYDGQRTANEKDYLITMKPEQEKTFVRGGWDIATIVEHFLSKRHRYTVEENN